VDIAVLEVGLGGRWDATNATDPIVSVITSVSLDHTEWLGTDVSRIAVEKAMILRPGRPLIVNGVGAAALEAILSTARSLHAIPVLGGQDFFAGWEDPGHSMWFQGRRWNLSGLSPGLPGLFQLENAATALAALECLDERGFNLKPAAIAGGISEAAWPGRFQDLGGAPDILVDAAHNRAAVEALIGSLRGRKRIVWLFSALADKDIEGMSAAMLEGGKDFVLVPLDNPRACPLSDLKGRISRGARVAAALTLAEGLNTARSLAGPEGTVVVAGSIYLAGEVLRIMGRRDDTSGRGG
ncbi:MAG: bifunctional folylpolyglutamate synthase/dihydrofolate synthase, partial [Proteobacteria bacterium]|nr:bifunctional folylpolyglutamate synthase/dihydrofolate synthase [Pseudomonadota bacterium]